MKFKELIFKYNKLFLLTIIVLLLVIVVSLGIDSKKKTDLNTLINAVYSFASEHEGRLPDTDGVDTLNGFPKKPTCIGSARSCFNLARAGAASVKETIVPSYINSLPRSLMGGSDSNTGYYIYKNSDGEIVGETKGILGNTLRVVR